jgi:cyanophycin synthetase
MYKYLLIIIIIYFYFYSNPKLIKKSVNKENQFPYLSKKSIEIYNKNNIFIKKDYLLDTKNNKKFFFKKNLIENNESRKIASDKGITSRVLQLNNIPVPNYVTFNLITHDFKLLEKNIKKYKIKFPLVLKPLQSHQAKGIVLDIKNFKDLKNEITKLSNQKIKKGDKYKKFKEFIIEEFKKGNSYRIYMIKEGILNVYCKEKPYVIGDGKHNVIELINIFNKKADNKINFMIKKYDKKLILSQIKFTSIVPKNKKIILSHITTRHNGSNVYNIDLNKIHPDNIEMFKKIQKSIGLTLNGIDYITNDITKSWKEGNGFINEINSGPGFTGEIFLNKNKLDKLFNKFINLLRSNKSMWI